MELTREKVEGIENEMEGKKIKIEDDRLFENKLNENGKKLEEKFLKSFEDENFKKRYEENDDKKIENENHQLSKKYYEKAGEIAKQDDVLMKFSDHREVHINEVKIKTFQAYEALGDALKVKSNEHYNNNINKNELIAAAIWHDTGMDGGYNSDDLDGNTIRSNHALNSALHVLENAGKLKEMGLDPNRVAVLCLAHSKSCSGIGELTSVEKWTKAFEKLEVAVNEYNNKNEEKINFDKSLWYNGNGEINKEEIAKTAFMAAALRLGDANRDYNENAKTQAGHEIEFDPKSYVKDAANWKDEIKNANVYIKNEKEEIKLDPEKGSKAIMYTVGEGNITSINCDVDRENGKIIEIFNIKDGANFPKCTQQCIVERIKELITLNKSGGLDYRCVINIENIENKENEKETLENYKHFINDFINKMQSKREQDIDIKLYLKGDEVVDINERARN